MTAALDSLPLIMELSPEWNVARVLAGLFYFCIGVVVFVAGSRLAQVLTRLANDIHPSRRRRLLPVITKIVAVMIMLLGATLVIAGLFG